MRLPPNAQSCISCIDSCIQLLFSGRMGAAVHAGVVNDPGVAEGLSRAGDVGVSRKLGVLGAPGVIVGPSVAVLV